MHILFSAVVCGFGCSLWVERTVGGVCHSCGRGLPVPCDVRFTIFQSLRPMSPITRSDRRIRLPLRLRRLVSVHVYFFPPVFFCNRSWMCRTSYVFFPSLHASHLAIWVIYCLNSLGYSARSLAAEERKQPHIRGVKAGLGCVRIQVVAK